MLAVSRVEDKSASSLHESIDLTTELWMRIKPSNIWVHQSDDLYACCHGCRHCVDGGCPPHFCQTMFPWLVQIGWVWRYEKRAGQTLPHIDCQLAVCWLAGTAYKFPLPYVYSPPLVDKETVPTPIPTYCPSHFLDFAIPMADTVIFYNKSRTVIFKDVKHHCCFLHQAYTKEESWHSRVTSAAHGS